MIQIDYFANELTQAFEEKDVSTKFQKVHYKLRALESEYV